MKRILLSSVCLVVLSMSTQVSAADLAAKPYTKAPALAPIYNWTGFYVGGHIGGSIHSGLSSPGVGDSSEGRFLGGAQIGADYQFAPNLVVGIQGQYSWLDNSGNAVSFPGTDFIYTNSVRALGSVTGRFGYSFGPGLLYAKGGYAYSDNRDSVTLLGAPVAVAFDHGHRDGFTVGAGLEYMFTQNWAGFAEYQYYDFGHSAFVAPAPLAAFGDFNNNEHTVKVGLNYRFGLGGPFVARY
jgi:outer membrane immunogenic protein